MTPYPIFSLSEPNWDGWILPNETTLNIFTYLSCVELSAVALSCKEFRVIARPIQLSRTVYRLLGHPDPEERNLRKALLPYREGNKLSLTGFIAAKKKKCEKIPKRTYSLEQMRQCQKWAKDFIITPNAAVILCKQITEWKITTLIIATHTRKESEQPSGFDDEILKIFIDHLPKKHFAHLKLFGCFKEKRLEELDGLLHPDSSELHIGHNLPVSRGEGEL